MWEKLSIVVFTAVIGILAYSHSLALFTLPVQIRLLSYFIWDFELVWTAKNHMSSDFSETDSVLGVKLFVSFILTKLTLRGTKTIVKEVGRAWNKQISKTIFRN